MGPNSHVGTARHAVGRAANRKAIWQTDEHETHARPQPAARWRQRRGWWRQRSDPPSGRRHPFDSSGPDLRIRGTAQQLFEKYLQLGRDATGVGDRVTAESYFQYAEHYFRILNAMNQAQQGGSSGGQQGRRPSMHESQQDYDNDGEDQDSQPAGSGDQPNGHGDARDIPITSGASND